MSLETIKKKILEEADGEKKKILDEGHSKAEKIKKEVEKKIEVLRQKFQEEVEKLQKEALERIRNQTESQARNNILEKKQELISEVFKQALVKLSQESRKERERLLDKFLEDARKDLTGGCVISSTKRDREILQKLVDKYKGFKLDEKAAEGQGGFVVSSKEIEQDYTYDNVILEARERLESEVAKILFS